MKPRNVPRFPNSLVGELMQGAIALAMVIPVGILVGTGELSPAEAFVTIGPVLGWYGRRVHGERP